MTQPLPKKPRKPKQPKSKKVNVSVRSQWEAILKSVTKEEVPVEMLESLTVNLVDGSKVNIDIRELLTEGYKPREIEEHINSHLDQLDDMIDDVDFFISIDSVAKTVQPITDEILKNL
jgi:hypothetical protein